MDDTLTTRKQTEAYDAHRGLGLLTSIPSPYTRELSGIGGVSRNIRISEHMKAYIDNYIVTAAGNSYIGTTFVDDNNGNAFVENVNIASNFAADTSSETIYAQAAIDIQAYALTKSYGTTSVFGMFATTNGYSPTESALSISLVTGTGATGTQVSSTKGAWVTVTGTVTTTASISGNAAGNIFVEVAPTNSATAGDWVEKGRIGNSQALSLAITLQSVQAVSGSVAAYVPAGYYIKARTAGSGTVSYTLNEARQVV